MPGNPLHLLLYSWDWSGGRRFIADLGVNVALYVPLGMSGYLALRSWILPMLFGCVLSAGIEMTQLFIPGRVCSSVDLMTNVLGTVAGVLIGIVFEKIAGPVRFTTSRSKGRTALAMLLLWAASLSFPFFPETRILSLQAKISAFLHGPVLSPIPLISTVASWFAVGLLLRQVTARRTGVWLVASTFLVPVEILIVGRQPLPVLVLGAVAGVVLFVLCYSFPAIDGIAAWAFVVLLVVRGLAPFHFTAQRQSFEWMPFVAFLNTEWQTGLRILLEKLFYYGTAIWLLRHARVTWPGAVAVVCTVLACIEFAQTHIPGRTPEITDPLLALLIGSAFAIMRIHDESSSRPDGGESSEKGSGTLRSFRSKAPRA